MRIVLLQDLEVMLLLCIIFCCNPLIVFFLKRKVQNSVIGRNEMDPDSFRMLREISILM